MSLVNYLYINISASPLFCVPGEAGTRKSGGYFRIFGYFLRLGSSPG